MDACHTNHNCVNIVLLCRDGVGDSAVVVHPIERKRYMGNTNLFISTLQQMGLLNYGKLYLG